MSGRLSFDVLIFYCFLPIFNTHDLSLSVYHSAREIMVVPRGNPVLNYVLVFAFAPDIWNFIHSVAVSFVVVLSNN